MTNKINAPYMLTPGGTKRTNLTEEAAPVEMAEEMITEDQVQSLYEGVYNDTLSNLTEEEVQTLIVEYADALTLQTLSEEYGIEVEEVEE
jgi:hypothetical protein